MVNGELLDQSQSKNKNKRSKTHDNSQLKKPRDHALGSSDIREKTKKKQKPKT